MKGVRRKRSQTQTSDSPNGPSTIHTCHEKPSRVPLMKYEIATGLQAVCSHFYLHLKEFLMKYFNEIMCEYIM